MRGSDSSSDAHARHWDAAYGARGVRGVSWHQDAPVLSLELIDALDVERDTAVIDVGGGASTLTEHLLERGFGDLTVLDVSSSALAAARARLAPRAPVAWLHEDLLSWRPQRHFGLWHDRAVLQFFVQEEDRQSYLAALRSALMPAGFVVIATFAPDGPERCSGLPVIRYSADDLCRLMGPGFRLREMRREEHVTPSGVAQPFTWVAGRLAPT